MKLGGCVSPSREGIGVEETNFLVASDENNLLAISDFLQYCFKFWLKEKNQRKIVNVLINWLKLAFMWKYQNLYFLSTFSFTSTE